jgi:hypothetical protein
MCVNCQLMFNMRLQFLIDMNSDILLGALLEVVYPRVLLDEIYCFEVRYAVDEPSETQ